jgi:hypothetical protein
MKKVLAVLVATFALAIPSAAMAENPPSQDEGNFSTWSVMTYNCGHTDYMGCGWWQNTQAYFNGSHWYVIVHYTETPGWGVYWNYCTTTSYWRGYYHIDTLKWSC